jgi:hypothetical protein
VIAHGLGRFTAKQLKRHGATPGSLSREMRAIGVAVRDASAVITAEALAGCAGICRDFVTGLDARSRP